MSRLVTIKIPIDKAVYQAKARTYRLGRAFGKTPEETANIQVSADDIAVRDVEGDVRRALSAVADTLNPYVLQYNENEYSRNEEGCEKCECTECDNKCKAWVIELDMPSNFDARAVRTIQDAAFRYCVARALADWYTDVRPDAAAPYSSEAEVRLNEVKAALYKRVLVNYNSIS